MASTKPYPILLGFFVIFFLARPTLAFGAGNIAGISKVEGQNWRHGDIEDTLLRILMARAVGGKKFDKMMVSRVYFGNWLRDYSQAIDVGTVKSVSAEAIRLLLSVLGFLTFGYGSREFEVTTERLGCYRPEDHIDNPKNYADNVDARQYDRRLRGPIDERIELAVDRETGMKNYIANDRVGIMTSGQHVRNLFGNCIELARSYQSSRDKSQLYEALRLLGTGLHCLEDFLAHSNYTELALLELGERDVFPHVGRNTRLQISGVRHEVYPCVTGTFGGVDFLHSVAGEVSDKLSQNEIQVLEGTLQNSQSKDTSMLRDLLDKIPNGLLGGDKKQKMDDIQNNANASQLQNMTVSPRDPEEFTRYCQDVFRQIMPAIQFHDELLQTISEAIDKIPILPKILEQLQEQLNVYVFSIMAPFIVPVIEQIKNELATGSNEIIASSQNEQHVVFEDDESTDPTHSMLSKDHFSNILNEIAGRTASNVVAWVVPQLMEAWDDHNVDINRTLNRIIHGVLHHPAQRAMGEDGASDGRRIMFDSIEEWWKRMDERAKDEYRQKLSRSGVERGENHKEGVHDTGHGCGKPLGMHKFQFGGNGDSSMEDRIAGAAAGAIMEGLTGGFSNIVEGQTGVKLPRMEQQRQESSGLGGLIGGMFSGFGKEEKESHHSSDRTDDGGYRQTTTKYGSSGDRYEKAEYSQTSYPEGGEYRENQGHEHHESGGRHGHGHGRTGEGYEQRTETSYGGGYEGRTEPRHDSGRSEEGYERQQEHGQGDDHGYGRSHHEDARREDWQRDDFGGGRDENSRRDAYGSGYGEEDRHEYGGSDKEHQSGSDEYTGGRGRNDDESGENRGDDGDPLGGLLGGIARAAGDAFRRS